MVESAKPIATKTFTTELIMEGSWGKRDLGMHQSTMDLYEVPGDAGRGYIEWEAPEADVSEEIGLWYEMRDGRRHLTDYDGVMSLPHEAVLLLEGAGIVVDEEFK